MIVAAVVSERTRNLICMRLLLLWTFYSPCCHITMLIYQSMRWNSPAPRGCQLIRSHSETKGFSELVCWAGMMAFLIFGLELFPIVFPEKSRVYHSLSLPGLTWFPVASLTAAGEVEVNFMFCAQEILPGAPAEPYHGSAPALAASPLPDDVFAAAQSGANVSLPPPRRHKLLQELLLHREQRRREDCPVQQPAAGWDPPGYSQRHETRVPGLQPHHCGPSRCFCWITSPGWVGPIA